MTVVPCTVAAGLIDGVVLVVEVGVAVVTAVAVGALGLVELLELLEFEPQAAMALAASSAAPIEMSRVGIGALLGVSRP